MQSIDKIITCYNEVASDYAAHRKDELEGKRLDRLLLKEFALTNKDTGPLVDFGCGPGHTTKFLFDHGARNIIGTDISPGMIHTAQVLFPEIHFEIADMSSVPYESGYFGGGIAFYAIVHMSIGQVEATFREVGRVIKTGGEFLFSFHLGSDIVHFERAHEKSIDIDVYFFQTGEIIEVLDKSGFRILDVIERQHYSGLEWATKRAYFWVKNKRT